MSIKLVKRSQGKSAVAAAAYRSGEKLVNDYDGMVHDYTRKGGVVHSEILLPGHAPPEFSQRSILWNAVEKVEKHRCAQLAREIEVALPVELGRDQQIELVRGYCKRTFVDAGMCADICIHDKEGGNPHAHILLTMRPLNPDRSWGNKQKKEYLLDENGHKVYDPIKRQYKCSTVPTTDWNEQTKAEEWRQAWAESANQALLASGIGQVIDHRSYERQGIKKVPTVHMGVAASQMEQRGMVTEKGNLNRAIAEDTQLIGKLFEKIESLKRQIEAMESPPKSVVEQLAFYQSQLKKAQQSQHIRKDQSMEH